MIFTEKAKGIWILEPEIHGDIRGYLYESYRADEFQKNGLSTDFDVEKVGWIKPGWIELGDKGYVVSVNDGKTKVLAKGLEIEISGADKKQVYIEKGIGCSLEIKDKAKVILKIGREPFNR